MSNVSSREKTIRVIEVSVPNPATARDISDLMRVAVEKCKEIAPERAGYDDAFMVEARDDEIVAVITADD